MAHRVNTRNLDGGTDCRTGLRKDWQKFFSRHLGSCTAAEILAFDWLEQDLPQIKKEVKKRFAPRLVGEHLYILTPDTVCEICIGYVDKQSERGYYMIQLASEFGEDCEVCRGKKAACERLFELYKQATA